MSGVDGLTTNYYCDALCEMVFHDATQMPTVESDAQQINKNRHVGNDFVQVIWSEHWRDYDVGRTTPHSSVGTIKSQVPHAHIVIYPLPNGLFRVQIFKRGFVAHFGPLQHSMTVTKQLLPLLVRQVRCSIIRRLR